MTAQDTTTTLNPGAGGDVMDGSLVTQAGTGSAVAKRQRVVISGDAQGAAVVDPVVADPGASPYSVPALAMALVDDTPESYQPGEIRPVSMRTDGAIRVYQLGYDEPSFTDASPFAGSVNFAPLNPWG